MENNRYARTIVVILVPLKIGVAENITNAIVTDTVADASTISNQINAAEVCMPYIIPMICIIVLLVTGIILAICYLLVYRKNKRLQRGQPKTISKTLQQSVNEDEVVSLTSSSTSQDTEVNIDERDKVINEQEIENRYKVETQKKSDETRKLQEQSEALKKTITQLQEQNASSEISDIKVKIKIRDKVTSEQEIEISYTVADRKMSDEIRKLREENEASKKTIIQLQEQNEPSKVSDLEVKITKLEKVNNEQVIKIRDLECQDEQKSDEIRKLKERDEASNKTITQLQGILNDLEERLYPKGNSDYAERPTLTHTIITYAGSQRREPINGMAILGQELLVSHENKSVIEVYDSETFQFVRHWVLEGMSHLLDIASCKITNCLYIIFRGDNKSESSIMKLDTKGEMLGEWSTGGDRGRLSTYESNVIVCLFEKQMIKEFSGDGNLISTVPLSPAVGFNHPWHAIKVSNNHFAVCHGDAKDELHRVCIVDVQGNIIKEIRQGMKQKLNVPICLVEDSGRSILVADRENQKIRLLSCVLKRELSLIKKETGLDHYPVRICLDEAKGRLFVAENKKEGKDGRILVFNIR